MADATRPAPPAVPAPSAPAASLNALPADLLLAILRLLPTVPRIRTLATLNKRWRELAYRSVDSLNEQPLDKLSVSGARYHEAGGRLTSLMSLNIDLTRNQSYPTEYTLPTTLRHLGMYSTRQVSILEPRPALTSLQLRSASPAYAAPLLALFASSVRRLSLQMLTFVGPCDSQQLLSALRLPSLTDLTVITNESDSSLSLCDFYRPHATQLEALTLSVPMRHDLAKAIVEIDHPRLRTLTWMAKRGVPSAQGLQQLLSSRRAISSACRHDPMLRSRLPLRRSDCAMLLGDRSGYARRACARIGQACGHRAGACVRYRTHHATLHSALASDRPRTGLG